MIISILIVIFCAAFLVVPVIAWRQQQQAITARWQAMKKIHPIHNSKGEVVAHVVYK